MEKHDKGGALPKGITPEMHRFQIPGEDGYRSRGAAHRTGDKSEYKRVESALHSRSTRILGFLRGGGEMSVTEIAKFIREPHSVTERVLSNMRGRKQVTCECNGTGERFWFIPKRQLKEHRLQQTLLSAPAAKFMANWTRLSISAREVSGIAVSASYPFVRDPEENSSSRTIPLTAYGFAPTSKPQRTPVA